MLQIYSNLKRQKQQKPKYLEYCGAVACPRPERIADWLALVRVGLCDKSQSVIIGRGGFLRYFFAVEKSNKK